MDSPAFREALLSVMEGKEHWAWPAFTSGAVDGALLHFHLESEWVTYVRDFPVLVGRAYVRCPLAEVRQGLAENLYEEETGGVAAGRPHPELFLLYPKGLGMDLSRFERPEPLPCAAGYRRVLDQLTLEEPWEVALAVTTLFLEGTPHERGELDESAPKRPAPPLEEHPLVKHYGLPLEALALTRAHRSVEGSHRAAAWRAVLGATEPDRRARVVEGMRVALSAWLAYRDGVAAACGVVRAP